MRDSIKKLWQWFGELGLAVQTIVLLGSSGIIGYVVFLLSWFRGLLLGILTRPIVRWHIETWATVLGVFAIAFSFCFLLGRFLGARRNKPIATAGKPFSIVPEAFGTWEHNDGPLNSKLILKMCFWVTNTEDRRVSIVKCEMQDVALFAETEVFAEDDRHAPAHFYFFKPNEAVLVRVSFFFDKIKVRSKADYLSNVTLTDSLGNTYTHGCRFKYQSKENR